ncbi:MAG: hypothetical protein ABF242_10625 [Flavobacteriales bacterium]
MKKIIFITTILALGYSCNKINCSLPAQTNGTGEIISNAEIVQTNILDVDFNREYVINSDSANTIDAKVEFNNGTTDSINFTNYTLLGKWAEGGCNVVIERDVERKNSEKRLIYTLEVHECGNCDMLTGSMNWVLVPKIPEDYTVEFIVK